MYEVKTASLTKGPICSIGGFCVLSDYNINSVPANYEALILVGGMAWRNGEVHGIQPLVEKYLERRKVLGGIRDASGFPGTAGALDSADHTSNDLGNLEQWAGKVYAGEQKCVMRQVVRDGNIVTTNGTAPLEFIKEVLLALKTAPEKVTIE